jgi:hypothetical protein
VDSVVFMKKVNFLVLVLGLVISLILLVTPLLTAKSNYVIASVPFTHSFTKAICSSKNFCEDYEVYCSNQEVLSIKATGYAMQFSESWQDPRDEETIKNSC